QEAWRQGDFERAQQRFADPIWKGGAAYRAGDWEAAAQHYAQQDSAQAHYNRGNALARQGELEQAMSAYQRALSLDTDLKDAEHNRSVVEKLLQQQEQQKQQQGKQDPQSGEQKPQENQPQPGQQSDDQSGEQQDQPAQPSDSGDQQE